MLEVLWKKAASGWHGVGLEAGLAFEETMRAVKKARAEADLSTAAILETFLVGACWDDARKFSAGLVDSDVCALCGAKPGDLKHLLYHCPATAAIDDPPVQKTEKFAEKARADDAQPCLWLRGLFPQSWFATVDPPSRLFALRSLRCLAFLWNLAWGKILYRRERREILEFALLAKVWGWNCLP